MQRLKSSDLGSLRGGLLLVSQIFHESGRCVDLTEHKILHLHLLGSLPGEVALQVGSQTWSWCTRLERPCLYIICAPKNYPINPEP